MFYVAQVHGVQPVAPGVHAMAGGARLADQLHPAPGGAAAGRAPAPIATLPAGPPLSQAAGGLSPHQYQLAAP